MTPIPVPQTSLLICQYSSSPPLLPPTNIPSQLKFKREVFEVSIKKILIHAKRFIMEKKKYSPNRGHKKDRESPHSAIYVYRQFEFPRRPRFYQSPVPREITHTITRASRAIYNSYNRRAMIPDVKDLSERGRGEESKNFFSIN